MEGARWLIDLSDDVADDTRWCRTGRGCGGGDCGCCSFGAGKRGASATVGEAGGDLILVGYEKLTEFLLLGRASRLGLASCCATGWGSTASLITASDFLAADRSPTAACVKYAPLLGSLSLCDPTLSGGAAIPRLFVFLGGSTISFGILGTGGLSAPSWDKA